MSVLKKTVLPGRVSSTAYCATWKGLFYSRLCYLDVSLLQHTVLPLEVSVLQQTVIPGRVCSSADCDTMTCLFYSRLCYLDVSLLHHTVLPANVPSTADCDTWTCLFYSRLCYFLLRCSKKNSAHAEHAVKSHNFSTFLKK